MAGLVEDTDQPAQDKRRVVVAPPGSGGTNLLRGGIAVRGVEWSGLSDVEVEQDGRAVRVPMSGIMIVGVKDPLVFSLHTQDIAPYAMQANPVAERAMRTFDLQPQ